MNEFGKRLRILRGEMSLSELAIKVETTKAMLSRYENGKVEPGLKVLRRLANYFNVTLDWICGNGDADTIQYTSKNPYNSVIDACIKDDISPEKLQQIIDIVRK